jgi:hypothetical protein
MHEDVSLFRLHLLRALYLGNFLMLGLSVWPGILTHSGWANPLEGVAVAFWGALSLLCIVGVRYPLKMLPLVFLQFTYKLIWLLAVALPRLSTGAPTWYMKPMLLGALVEPLLIPWPYVLANYVRNRGDRWRDRSLTETGTVRDGVQAQGSYVK